MPPHHGPTNPSPATQAEAGVRRYGCFTELRPEKEEAYRRLHAEVWPEVLAAIERANIRNYSIWLQEIGGKKYVFSTFEYTGADPEADFATIRQDETTRERWWPLTDACMATRASDQIGDVWTDAEMLMWLNGKETLA